MKYLFILMFFTSYQVWSQDRLNDENYYKKFPIEEMILGEWFLEKIEIVSLSNNDTSLITSLEPGRDKIVFSKNTYKTIPDTTGELYYKPSYEFYYKIEKDKYSSYNEIVVVDRKYKKTFDNFNVLLYTFDRLIIENYQSNFRLGQKYSRVKYNYKRKDNDNPTITGKWLLAENSSFFSDNAKDTTWQTFLNYNNLQQDSLAQIKVKTEVEFTVDNKYWVLNSSTYTAVFGGASYIVDNKENKIYFISKEIHVYDYTFDPEGNLKIKFKNSL